MLIPLNRTKFEQLVPILATGLQYAYYWGKFPDLLKRVMISVVSLCVVVFIIGNIILGEGGVTLTLAVIAGLYWLWAPVFWASWRNFQTRRYAYSGFLRGEVLDLFVSEELIGSEQTVNNRGQLVIVENRERRLNLEVGDETGFTTQLQAPLRREHQDIAPGQIVEMIVMSNRSDLSLIGKVSELYIPSQNLWVSDYPYLQRNVFIDVSRRLQNVDDSSYSTNRSVKSRRKKRK